jgi:hypothetical protein
MTEARQNLSQQVKGRRGRGVDKAWAHRMLLLRAGETLTENAAHRLQEVFAAEDRQASSLADAAAAKEDLKVLVEAAARPETNKLYRTVCRWWKEIEVLIVTGATMGKVEANNTAIKHIKRTARGCRNPSNYKSVILMRSPSGRWHDTHPRIPFPMNREEPVQPWTTAIVETDAKGVMGMIGGEDHRGVGDWFFDRTLAQRAVRWAPVGSPALRMWLT